MAIDVVQIVIEDPTGTHRPVTFGLVYKYVTPRMIGFLEMISTLPIDHDEIFHTLLIQSMIDASAFTVYDDSHQVAKYLAHWSKQLGFRYVYDVTLGTWRVVWPSGLIIPSLNKALFFKLARYYHIYASEDVVACYE